MSTSYYFAPGKIVSGRGIGNYVYCFTDTGFFPICLKDEKLVFKNNTLIEKAGYYGSNGAYLWNGLAEFKRFSKNSKYIFTPQTVARIEILASTSTGPSASNFVKGTLLAGAAVGAAAAMSAMGSEHTVKVTWKDNNGSQESIITFKNSTAFQAFIGQLGSLMNQPNAATPAPSFPAISSADEILKFKKLMDEGIITQAEFEAKKKQLLGIENTVINSSGVDIEKQCSGGSDKDAIELGEELSTTNIGGVEVSPEVGAKIIKYLQDHPDNGKVGAMRMLRDSTGIGITESKMAIDSCNAAVARKAAADARKEAEEKAEKRREAKEEAKLSFDAYWEAHSDERKELEAEQKALKDQIISLNASINEQAATLKKEIAAIPGKDEIENLDARMKKLSEDYAALGIFKGKEKKDLQDQYVQAEADKKAIQKKMTEAKAALEANAAASKRETLGKISQLQSRVQSINTELTKER